MKSTIRNNCDSIETKHIDIKKLLNDLENIGNEKDKKEFIINYSRLKEEIKIVDDILNYDNLDEIEAKVEDYQTKSIDELFKILENNEDKIFGNEILTIQQLKSLLRL